MVTGTSLSRIHRRAGLWRCVPSGWRPSPFQHNLSWLPWFMRSLQPLFRWKCPVWYPQLQTMLMAMFSVLLDPTSKSPVVCWLDDQACPLPPLVDPDIRVVLASRELEEGLAFLLGQSLQNQWRPFYRCPTLSMPKLRLFCSSTELQSFRSVSSPRFLLTGM